MLVPKPRVLSSERSTESGKRGALLCVCQRLLLRLRCDTSLAPQLALSHTLNSHLLLMVADSLTKEYHITTSKGSFLVPGSEISLTRVPSYGRKGIAVEIAHTPQLLGLTDPTQNKRWGPEDSEVRN